MLLQPRATMLLSSDEHWTVSVHLWNVTGCGGRPPRYAPAPLLPPRGCRRALRRRAVGNVAAESHGQHVLMPTAAAAWRANMAVSKAAWWPWPFDLESGVRVTCEVGYLCDNFGLPRPFCSRFRPDVRDRQTSDRRQTKASLNAPAY